MYHSPAEWRGYFGELLDGEEPRVLAMEDAPAPELEAALPGISQLRQMGHGPFIHFESPHIWGHTLAVMRALEGITRRRLGRRPAMSERFAALTHDLGKLHTRQVGAEGATSFPGHERRGAELLSPLLPGLGFTPEESACILFLVAEHGNAFYLPTLPPDEQQRLRSSPFATQLAALQEADACSCWLDREGKTHHPSRWNEFFGVPADPAR